MLGKTCREGAVLAQARQVMVREREDRGTEADVSGPVNTFSNLEDFAVLRDGRMIGFEFRSASGNPPITDANSGNFLLIDSNDTGDTVVGTNPINSGLETWEGIPGNPPTVQRSAGCGCRDAI